MVLRIEFYANPPFYCVDNLQISIYLFPSSPYPLIHVSVYIVYIVLVHISDNVKAVPFTVTLTSTSSDNSGKHYLNQFTGAY